MAGETGTAGLIPESPPGWFAWPMLGAFALSGVGRAHSHSCDALRTQKKVLAVATTKQTRLRQEGAAAIHAEALRHPFAARVVGAQWLNPLEWKGYPTEWNVLWTFGLAKPNTDDELVSKKPAIFAKVRPVGGIAFNTDGGWPFDGYYETYVIEMLGKLRDRYFVDEHYFYSVAKKRNPMRDIAGIQVEMTLPPGLNAEDSASFARKRLASYIGINKPICSSTGEPPHINVHQGGSVAGFASVEAALDCLEAHPDKTVWVLAFDAPSFLKDSQLDETGALLVLVHRDYVTGREPLAWIHRLSRVPVVMRTVVPAWHAALDDSVAWRDLEPGAIRYLIHDAGQGSSAASKRLGDLAPSATETLSGLDFARQNFNTSALLGDLRAGTVATNLVLVIAYAHHQNVPVIFAGTHEAAAGGTYPDERAVTAVLVGHRLIQHHSTRTRTGSAPAAKGMPTSPGGTVATTPSRAACRGSRTDCV